MMSMVHVRTCRVGRKRREGRFMCACAHPRKRCMLLEGVHAISLYKVLWATVDYNNDAKVFPKSKMV